jgi:hypothetical protein
MDAKSILKHLKFGLCLPPQLKDNGNFDTNTYFDTAGLSGVMFLIIVGVTDAAIGSTAEGTAPLVEECDTTDGSYTAVTSAALADAISATEDSKLFAITVDLTKTHKRYMEVQAPHAADGTTGANAAIIAIGVPSGPVPTGYAAQGLTELIQA